MNLEKAEQLDSILRKFRLAAVQSFPFYSREEKEQLLLLLEQLKHDGYISSYGLGGGDRDDTGLPVFISPSGRSFIDSGGYTAIVKREERKEEEERLRMDYFRTANTTPVKEKNHKKKWIWFVFTVAFGVYFFYTKDDSKNIWENVNTYISIVGTLSTFLGGLGFFRSI